jgi:outer membrane lipoprotein-sorting protein
VALAALCLNSFAYGNGIDVDSFLRDMENKRGKVETYSARFVQVKTIALFDETKTSTGTLLYKAPQKMIWKYETPDKTQMRIEAESVAFYFPELEQIEVYPIKESGGASGFFSAFETGAEELKKNFEVSAYVATDSIYRVELVPKSEPVSSQISQITLWLKVSDYLPRKMRILEISGDSTAIDMSEIRINEPIADDELEFDAPKGTTIIEGDSNIF